MSPDVAELEIFVPVLLNFRDNGLIYGTGDMDTLQEKVLSKANGISKSHHEDALFRHELVKPDSTAPDGGGNDAWPADVERVEVYYYHHRIILRYLFAQAPAGGERVAREAVRSHSTQVLERQFVARINTVHDGGPLPDEHGRVTSYYSYCLIFLLESPGFRDKMESLLGSHTFRIVEVTPKLYERDRMHLVRISIPSTNVYYRKDVGHFLKVDILNAIYQHMLYAKKEKDEDELLKLVDFTPEATSRHNVMQESQLHALWDHAVDALGGRTVDLHTVGQQANLFRISFLAVILAALSSVVAVVSLIEVLR